MEDVPEVVEDVPAPEEDIPAPEEDAEDALEEEFPEVVVLYRDRIWSHMQITYSQTQLSYVSEIDPSIALHVQLDPNAVEDPRFHERIVQLLGRQAALRNIRRIEWKIESPPPFYTLHNASFLLRLICIGRTTGVERLAMVGTHAGADYLSNLLKGADLSRVRFQLELNCDRLLLDSSPIRVLENIERLVGWQRHLELYIYANQIAHNAAEWLQRYSHVIQNIRERRGLNMILGPRRPRSPNH
ncbi:hypothetical protein TRVA0_016S01068 [Trichomonascus vanleenenianus]|uniref:uncharacterized protein n=1 Tax=Trichomonascus vanleenenianus TaxID=2268995 RepID=UPI003EC95FFE